MPKRTDIKKILVIGSGPIIIGQACEFDYSGTQACKVLREDGYEVILINSNPATIMTDPELANKTYIEPITPEIVAKIIEKERPDALLPTLGGQTGLNTAVSLYELGVLDKFNVELIGADIKAIRKAEDRSQFKKAMSDIGLYVPVSDFAYNMDDVHRIAGKIGFPLVVRPSFTLGGSGGGIAFNKEELNEMAKLGLALSPISEILIEESVAGWKEYELEVMRDKNDNVVIVCTIENFDPMGVHTGDSITVAPAQTLTDKEMQDLRDASIRCIREIGVETGGSNIQFAVNPDTGQVAIIEMNPRVSRSSALASKATGFPIAKIAAKLAVGYTLDEIPNDITRKTPACFEPSIDYVVVKTPRWAFEKFPLTDSALTTRMKSVGEAMSIGRTFKEALQKALRSLEIGKHGLGWDGETDTDPDRIEEMLTNPNQDRMFYVREALDQGWSTERVHELSNIDPWFLDQIKQIIDFKNELKQNKGIALALRLGSAYVDPSSPAAPQDDVKGAAPQDDVKGAAPQDDVKGAAPQDHLPDILKRAKRLGFSDKQIAHIFNVTEQEIRSLRAEHGIKAVFKSVDTCAGEFEAYTPYYYSTYEDEDEVRDGDKKKIMILGSGPNRIGQGIEFDYCCVHASFALRENGYESIMVNCNPETVSTDYDTSDRLYFEPLTFEDVMNIIDREKPEGVIVQLGGQTPLKLANALEEAGVNILGTSPDSIDLAEDRKRFGKLIEDIGIPQAPNGTATSTEEALVIASRIGYPVLVRPSYVLGGRAMEIVYNDEMLTRYMKTAVKVSPEHPVLVDRFLEDAIEIDVDALFDGETFLVGGVMEHIEEAGIHSGDSACILPPHTIPHHATQLAIEYTEKLARALKVVGLINVQLAYKDDVLYVLEANPRASRTVPFVSKATGRPLAKIGTMIMAGKKLKDMVIPDVKTGHVSVKEAVLPFNKFPGEDIVLGPEMKSTGEVMGIDTDFGAAFAKAQLSAGAVLPLEGKVFISVCDKDKAKSVAIAVELQEMGFELFATAGTASFLSQYVKISPVHKADEGSPSIVDLLKEGKIDLVINTPYGRGPRTDGYQIRAACVMNGIPCITTIAGADAATKGIRSMIEKGLDVKPIQAYLDMLPQEPADEKILLAND